MRSVESDGFDGAFAFPRQHRLDQIRLWIRFADPFFRLWLPSQDDSVAVEKGECRVSGELRLLAQSIDPIQLRGQADHGLHDPVAVEHGSGKNDARFCRHAPNEIFTYDELSAVHGFLEPGAVGIVHARVAGLPGADDRAARVNNDDASKAGISIRQVGHQGATNPRIAQEQRQTSQQGDEVIGVVDHLLMVLRRQPGQPLGGVFHILCGPAIVLDGVVNNQRESWQQRYQDQRHQP